MPASENLTRTECAERAASVDNASYEVELDLTGAHGPAASTTFDSTTTLRFDATEPGRTVWLDLLAESVDSVTFNGEPVDVDAAWDGARICLPPLASTNTVVVSAKCKYMRTGEGLHRFVDPVDDETYVYTQFEVADARRVYACFDQPDIKAPWRLTVTTPAHWQVISNSPTPQPQEVANGGRRWEFAATPRLSTYVTAIIAGPYQAVRDTYVGPNGTYPLGIFCRMSLAEHLDPDELFEVTKEGLGFFEKTFDTPYPFEKFDQLFVPEFNSTAMENAGCVTIREDLIFRSRNTRPAYEDRSNTILHELAHMWFGDLVTMKWWDDLWLNESFAEWASHYANVGATRYTEAWTSFLSDRKTWAYRQDQLPSTHPIAADMVDLEAVDANFDGITYAKGAAALRQLVAWVGDDQFLTGIRSYFHQHAWGNTRFDDLLTALSDASGRDLSHWADQWLQTSGVNLLRAETTLDTSGGYADVVVVQEPPSMPGGVAPTLRDHRVGVGVYRREEGRLTRSRLLEVDVTGSSLDVSELRGLPAAEILLPNDGDLTFAKIRLDGASQQVAFSAIGDVDDSLARGLIFNAAWDMTRDAEMSTGDFLAMAISGLAHEPDVVTVEQVLRHAKHAIDFYASPRNRDDYLNRFACSLRGWLEHAAAGSDHQLVFVRTLSKVATGPADIGVITGLLDGSAEVDGLVVDTDLRWALLKLLVIRGVAGEAEIDAEAARDDTAAGQRHAQQARSAIPTPEAKAAAWDTALHDLDLANHILVATIAGIMVPEQRDLLRPHVEEYFAIVPGLLRQRTTEMAQQIISGLYPALLVEPETITRTEQFFADNPGLEPAARRMISEGLDGVLRAMRCQERDAR